MKRSKLLLFITYVLLLSLILASCKSTPKKSKTKKNPSSSSASSEPDSSDTDSIIDDASVSDDDSDWDNDNEFLDNIDNVDDDIQDSEYIEEGIIANLNIYNAKTIQSDFLGFGGVYDSYHFMPTKYGSAYTDKERKLEIDRIKQMGITITRTQFSPSYAFDYSTNKWDFDSDTMKRFYKYLDEMDAAGFDVAMNIGWYTGEITSEKLSSDGAKQNPFYILANGNREKCIEYYAKWVADSVSAILSRGHSNLKYLIAFTEPGEPWNCSNNEQLIDKMKPYKELVLAAHNALSKTKYRKSVKIIGPNTVSDVGLVQLNYIVTDPDMLKAIDIFSHHFYVKSPQYDVNYFKWYESYFSEAKNIIAKSGKQFWVDEWNWGDSTISDGENMSGYCGTQEALAMIAGMNCGVQTMLRWSIVSERWPDYSQSGGEWKEGIQTCGLMKNLFTSTIPRPAYYSYSLLSKYTGRNSKVFFGEDSEDVFVSSCQRADGNWTIIAVNMNYEKANIKINLENSINKIMYRHSYNPKTFKPTVAARPIDADKTYRTVKNTLTDTMEPYSVHVYTSVKG